MVSIIFSFKFSLSSAAMLNVLVGVGSLPDSAVGIQLKEEGHSGCWFDAPAAALIALSGVHARPLHQC